MKTLCFILSVVYSTLVFSETSHYNVKEGKLHRGGNLSVEVLPDSSAFRVRTKYEILKRSWVPVPPEELRGETVLDLPADFRDERGYLELETKGEMKISDARLKFLKRINIGSLRNGFLIEVYPDNGKSKTRISYHSELPSAGWAKVEITFISHVPLLNGYQLHAELK